MRKPTNGGFGAGKAAGKLEAEFDHVKTALDTIDKKLDANLDWQRSVDVRLATCEAKGVALADLQETLEADVRRLGVTDKAIAGLAALGAFLAGLWGQSR